MDWDRVFALVNLWPLPFWMLLAFGPRNMLMARIVLFGGVAILALTYCALFILLTVGLLDPHGPAVGYADLASLNGVMGFFASKGGATVGWIHYLTLDLLTGLWVARNADRYGVHRALQGVVLFLVLMAGPLGLTVYLAVRHFHKNQPDNAAAPS